MNLIEYVVNSYKFVSHFGQIITLKVGKSVILQNNTRTRYYFWITTFVSFCNSLSEILYLLFFIKNF